MSEPSIVDLKYCIVTEPNVYIVLLYYTNGTLLELSQTQKAIVYSLMFIKTKTVKFSRELDLHRRWRKTFFDPGKSTTKARKQSQKSFHPSISLQFGQSSRHRAHHGSTSVNVGLAEQIEFFMKLEIVKTDCDDRKREIFLTCHLYVPVCLHCRPNDRDILAKIFVQHSKNMMSALHYQAPEVLRDEEYIKQVDV